MSNINVIPTPYQSIQPFYCPGCGRVVESYDRLLFPQNIPCDWKRWQAVGAPPGYRCCNGVIKVARNSGEPCPYYYSSVHIPEWYKPNVGI